LINVLLIKSMIWTSKRKNGSGIWTYSMFKNTTSLQSHLSLIEVCFALQTNNCCRSSTAIWSC